MYFSKKQLIDLHKKLIGFSPRNRYFLSLDKVDIFPIEKSDFQSFFFLHEKRNRVPKIQVVFKLELFSPAKKLYSSLYYKKKERPKLLGPILKWLFRIYLFSNHIFLLSSFLVADEEKNCTRVVILGLLFNIATRSYQFLHCGGNLHIIQGVPLQRVLFYH